MGLEISRCGSDLYKHSIKKITQGRTSSCPSVTRWFNVRHGT